MTTRTTRTTTSEPAFSRGALEARHALGWAVGVLLVLAVGAVAWRMLGARASGQLGVLAVAALCAGGLLLIAVGCGTVTSEYVRVTTTETTETDVPAEVPRAGAPAAAAQALVPQLATGMARLSPARSLVLAGVTLLLVAGAGAGLGYTLDQVAGTGRSTPSPAPSGVPSTPAPPSAPGGDASPDTGPTP
ncbi:hypothetical protein [Cellulomonas fimi]|uniref:Uncharacterized protein n=1 Tax=Cellulomonas fimi (strain ATCC 484 / DSM 20113 / JCM 1341 / CCUG 24087 / LMG 16345 / NBRC 15513 / NCIMB 8980 / NCTC 7547 / NRS-133) TaxID=590998 RepID=F4H1R3_CELFA|nr:hypothetical protein [Cellulomonas fimi]AEE47483.1 hypothetical protein Celf_3370 [Cellulomonas fimi ATCC 484]NNH05540.1 hypothetical protein [Cellulomonas fimi]VEH36342.1 Uncharacterised protein [Cellulomonas fimi]